MIILIHGSTHSGKTNLAQKILEKYNYNYLSIDYLKMGLIRSNNTSLTVEDDELLTPYLFNIIKEIIKTNIENNQNLVVEGIYIPFNFKEYFTKEELKEIKYICIILSEKYIKNNFNKIIDYGNIIENRMDDYIDINDLIKDNKYNLLMCQKYNLDSILIEEEYFVDLEIFK